MKYKGVRPKEVIMSLDQYLARVNPFENIGVSRKSVLCFPVLALALAFALPGLSSGCGDNSTAGEKHDAAVEDSGTMVDGGEDPDAALHDGSATDTGMQDAEPEPSHNPDEEGPYDLETVEDTVTRDGREIPLTVYIPKGDNEALTPVIVFVPGFQLNSSRYDVLAQRTASHGFIYIRSDPPASLWNVSHVAMAEDVSAVLDWALDPTGPLSGKIDTTAVGAMGHSLGGKVSTMAVHRDSRITALFGIDPVNEGGGPGGYTETNPDILPHELENEAIPVGFAGETVNATASGLGQACAPEGKNFIAFYDAAQSSPWKARWDFIGADHMDFVDDVSSCTVCGMCEDGTADPEEVSASLHILAVAFFRFHFYDETAMEPWLIGTSLPPNIDVVHNP